MNQSKLKFFLLFFLFIFSGRVLAADWRDECLLGIGNGGVYVEDQTGKPLLSHRAQESFIPASTIKVATAAAALQLLGKNYRFLTEFYLSEEGDLFVKGYGNPVLLSQELDFIAKELVSAHLKKVRNVVLDDTYFDPNIRIDGVEKSSNPYDAANSALLANYNTISVQKFKNGKVISGEAQTPLTALALNRAKTLGAGRSRVNLGSDPKVATLYAGEVLTEFLKKEGVMFNGKLMRGHVPEGARLVYRHESTQNLQESIREMLKYSTNLIANQLFLIMGATRYGAPATVDKGVAALSEFLKDHVGWQNVHLAEGAGLSRLNKVTPVQMMSLLRYMEPEMELLPLKQNVFRAKTGTLKGVHTFMGYCPMGNQYARFVVMLNDSKTPDHLKFKIAKRLYNHFNGVTSPSH